MRAAAILLCLPVFGSGLVFEVNRGQAARQYPFVARTAQGEAVLIGATALVLADASGPAVRVRLAGANPRARGEGLDPLPGRSHYLLGADPRGWVTGVAQYGRVRFRNVYPGIDVVYYRKGGRLEHDFVVAPGADPGHIRLRPGNGAELRLADSGDLLTSGRSGAPRLKAPLIYQESGAGRKEVRGGFRMDGKDAVIELAAYNRQRSLVIDPETVFSRQYAGNGEGYFARITSDAGGNLYLLGDTTSANYATGSAAQKRPGGKYDSMVWKLDRAGNVQWTTYLGGSENDLGWSIAVDAAGQAHIAGHTTSRDFPVTAGAIQRQPGQAQDGYIAKLSPEGDRFLYSTYLGGAGTDIVTSLALDASGNAIAAGYTGSPAFPVTPAVLGPFHRGALDAFVAKLNAQGTALLFSTFLGGSGEDRIEKIAVHPEGYIFATGASASPDFPTSPGAFQPRRAGGSGSDAFVAALSADGRTLAYGSYFGGAANDEGRSILLDGEGAVWFCGLTFSTDFPTRPQTALTMPGAGQSRPFVAHLRFPAIASPAGSGAADAGRAAEAPDTGGRSALPDPNVLYILGLSGAGYARNLSLGVNKFGLASSLNLITNDYTQTFIHKLDPLSGKASEPPFPAGYFTADMLVNPLWDLFAGFDKKTGQPWLEAQSNPGQQPAVSPNHGSKGEPVSTLTGELYETEIDLTLGGPLALGFARYYGSLLEAGGVVSALGVNWMHNFDQRLVRVGRRATVLLFGGRTAAFELSGGVYRPLAPQRNHDQLVAAGADYKFLEGGAARIYTFNAAGALTKIEDRNGNALTVTPSAQGPVRVADGLGRSLAFGYTGERLTSVEDQTGRRIVFTHTGALLTRATDAAGKNSDYTYASSGGVTGLMTARRQPAGNTPFSQSFDGAARVSSQADSSGNTTAFQYHQPRLGVTTIREPGEAVYRHTHSAAGSLAEVADPAGAASALRHDAAGRLTGFTDRKGNVTAAAYHDPSGFPASITDAEGNTTSFTYAAQTQGPFTFYNLTRIAYPDGAAVTFTYDAAGNPLTMTDEAGKLWRMTYGANGQLLTETNPAGGVTAYTYNQDLTLASARGAAGNVTAFGYDNRKRRTKTVLPGGAELGLAYDDRDLLVETKDELGRVHRLAYDDNRRLISVIDPEDRNTAFEYDRDNRPAASTDRIGARRTQEYDRRGRVVATVNAAGESIRYAYDALDRLTSASDAAGEAVAFTYDAEGVLTSVRDGLGRSWQIKSNRLGLPVESRSPLGRVTASGYDRNSRLTTVTDPLGQTARVTYDARGLPVSVALPGEASAAYLHTDLGQIGAVQDPNGNAWQREYDAQGRLTAAIDPLGRRTTLVYGAHGRVEAVQTGAGEARYEYDARGNLLRRTFADGSELAYSYDAQNRLTAADGVSLAWDANGRMRSSNGIEIARDAEGRITAMTLAPDKIVRYGYTASGLLSKVTDWLGGESEFTYNAARQLARVTRPNGVTTEYRYDGDGALEAIEEKRDGELASVRLTRDAAGRIVSAERNLPLAPALGAEDRWMLRDAAHQLADTPHDGLGRRLSDEGRAYNWDAASRLVSITAGAESVTNSYDGLGLLTGQGARSFVQNYALGLPSISVVREGGADLRYYLHLPGGVLFASIDAASGARGYYHFDEAGNTTMLTGDGGTATDVYAITPLGEVVSRTGESENPFTFQGAYGVMQEGRTGLFHMRARHYDSRTGAFLSRDPQPSLDPRSLSPYQYAWGDPLRYTDPTGLSSVVNEPYPGFTPDWRQSFLDRWLPPVSTSGVTVTKNPYYYEKYGGFLAPPDPAKPPYEWPASSTAEPRQTTVQGELSDIWDALNGVSRPPVPPQQPGLPAWVQTARQGVQAFLGWREEALAQAGRWLQQLPQRAEEMRQAEVADLVSRLRVNTVVLLSLTNAQRGSLLPLTGQLNKMYEDAVAESERIRRRLSELE